MNSTIEAKVERLTAEAFNALDVYDIKKALKVGRQLKKLRHSSAYEILALAYAADEKLNDAISILEEGVKTVPSVWILRQLLGNYYSDQGRYVEALSCYQQALECPNVNADSVHLNTSIALGRHGKYLEALMEVQQVTSNELEPRATSHKLYILNCAQRHAECIALGKSVITSAVWGDEAAPQFAAVHAELATALWKMQQDRDKALAHAWKAITLHKGQETAAWVIREVTNKISPASRHMTLLIRGRWPEPFEGETEAPGFFVTYEVVAETPQEAMLFIIPFEPEGVRETLAIEECTDREAAADQPKGVYNACRGYAFYPWEEET